MIMPHFSKNILTKPKIGIDLDSNIFVLREKAISVHSVIGPLILA
jgi:hypothetical protein